MQVCDAKVNLEPRGWLVGEKYLGGEAGRLTTRISSGAQRIGPAVRVMYEGLRNGN